MSTEHPSVWSALGNGRPVAPNQPPSAVLPAAPLDPGILESIEIKAAVVMREVEFCAVPFPTRERNLLLARVVSRVLAAMAGDVRERLVRSLGPDRDRVLAE